MAKPVTDIEQSKKLAKILPLDSADMVYVAVTNKLRPQYDSLIVRFIYSLQENDIPAWSLSALLKLLKDYTLQNTTDGRCFIVSENNITEFYDEPIDACVEIILALKEKDLL